VFLDQYRPLSCWLSHTHNDLNIVWLSHHTPFHTWMIDRHWSISLMSVSYCPPPFFDISTPSISITENRRRNSPTSFLFLCLCSHSNLTAWDANLNEMIRILFNQGPSTSLQKMIDVSISADLPSLDVYLCLSMLISSICFRPSVICHLFTAVVIRRFFLFDAIC